MSISINRMLTGLLILWAQTLQSSKPEQWHVDSTDEWKAASSHSEGLEYNGGMASPLARSSHYRSKVKKFSTKTRAQHILFKQSPVWNNWIAVGPVGPSNLGNAPVMLSLGPDDYWMFGQYKRSRKKNFTPQDATLEGFDILLKTTPYENQFDAPGGLNESSGGYHAWQSRAMDNWVHHGAETEKFSRWVTTAEFADCKAYIYYDYPNDQDPHVYVDDDLTDGVPGKNMGMAFKDPSHGSDCAVIRAPDGKFHVIYEDWSPINAQKHSWDSPLAGHAVSNNGVSDFRILKPAVDERTTPTGRFAEFKHPHWLSHPDYDSNIAKYEIHEPIQHAYGDWAAISIGGQYYLFGDYHPAGTKKQMSVAWFTSPSIHEQFVYCGHVGEGHPDPDVAFAEGKFYLITQTNNDFVSPGPWVEKVTARAGVDTNNDGNIDQWSPWQEIKESYDHIAGFAKQVRRIPAGIDLSSLPAGYGFCFEYKTEDTTDNDSMPIIDAVTLSFSR